MPTVNVIYHFEDEAWWADSPQVARWSAAADTVEELVVLVTEGVPFALETEGVEIEHRPAPDLIDVFAGRTVGGRLRLQITDAFREFVADSPRVAVGASGS